MSLFEVEEYPYQLFFKVAFSTGMRKGELLALTWKDVDFSRQTINVNKTLVRLPDGQMSFHPPKTKSGYRSITIHKSLTQELQAWRDKQRELLTPYCEDTNTLQLFQYIPEPLNEFRVKRAFDKAMSRTDELKEIRIRTRLNPDSVSPTMVTLPDDFIHPYFNRVLTVREMARIQSFDDSFEFLGKRTTGGDKRSQETPQFTQVGNAVPHLLARAIAEQVAIAINKN